MIKQDPGDALVEMQWDIEDWEWNAELTNEQVAALTKHLVSRGWRKQDAETHLA